MIQAIFFDIDGTLLNPETGTVPDSTLACLGALRKKGVKLFVATGRFPAMTTFIQDFFDFVYSDDGRSLAELVNLIPISRE